jgi:CRP/FNR family cyclic AMP-dependent transcriptional regulator
MRPQLVWTGGGPQAESFGSRRPHEPLLTLAERAALDAAGFYAALPMATRRDIECSCEVRSLRRGAAVYGLEAPGLCGVASGVASIRLNRPGSRILDYVPAGTWLLDPSALAGGPPFMLVEAHRRATVARLPRDTFQQIFSRHPVAASAMQSLAYSAVRQLAPILEELASLPLRGRLIRCVLRLCDSFGIDEPDGRRIALALSQDELARMLFGSRQRVNAELKSLEAAGLLRIEKGIVVRERAALEHAAR